MLGNVLYSFFTRCFVALINFVILLVSARYLGVSTRGEISVLILNIALVQLVCEVYTGYALVHFVPLYNGKKIILHGIGLIAAISCIGNLVLFLLGRQVAGAVIETTFLSIIVLMHTFFCVQVLGTKKIKIFSLLSLLQPFLLLVCLLTSIFCLRMYTLSAYLASLCISFSLALIVSAGLQFSDRKSAATSKQYSIRNILLKGLAFQISILFGIFMNRYNYYLLPLNQQVGMYSTACILCEALLIIANGLAPLLLASPREKPAPQRCLLLIKLAMICSALGLLLFQVFPEAFYVFVLGQGFEGIKNIITLYSPVILMQTLLVLVGSYYTGRGQTRILLLFYAPGAFVALLIAPLLISENGIRGAAYAANISFGLASCIALLLFCLRERISAREIFSLKFRTEWRECFSALSPH